MLLVLGMEEEEEDQEEVAWGPQALLFIVKSQRGGKRGEEPRSPAI